MSRFVLKLFILLLLCSGALLIFNRIGTTAGLMFKDGASVICEQKRLINRTDRFSSDKPVVLFMGNSRVLSGLRPDVFDENTENIFYSVNLGLPALPLSCAYYALKDYIEHNKKPEWIILDLYNIFPGSTGGLYRKYSVQGCRGAGEIWDYTVMYGDWLNFMEYLLPVRQYKYNAAEYLVKKVLKPGSIEAVSLGNKRTVERVLNARGYYFIKEQALFPDYKLPESYGGRAEKDLDVLPVYDSFKDPFTEKFFSLTEQKGIKVLLIQGAYRVDTIRSLTEVPEQFSAIMKRYSNVITAEEGWKPKIMKNCYFSDEVHLNRVGAAKYTKYIAEEFLECNNKVKDKK